MSKENRSHQRIKAVAKTALLSVGYIAFAAASPNEVHAQASPPAQQAPRHAIGRVSIAARRPGAASSFHATGRVFIIAGDASATDSAVQPTDATLPTVTVSPPRRRPRVRSTVRAPRPSAPPPSPPPPGAAVQAAWPTSATQDARTGTVGVYANSTSVATKVNTPLVNIPQSISVVTKEFIADNSFQNLTDITRYVPGVDIHQGEGNRDELIIRGVDSSANFFVNGFRDDVQIFRDLYNAQSVEVLKGPRRDHLRSWRRRRSSQPHAEGGRRPEDIRCDAADRILWRPTRHARCRPGRQRKLRRASQWHV